jgi:hypothetical protein
VNNRIGEHRFPVRTRVSGFFIAGIMGTMVCIKGQLPFLKIRKLMGFILVRAQMIFYL